MATLRSGAINDTIRLHEILIKFVGVDGTLKNNPAGDAPYKKHPIVLALKHAGVTKFNADFLAMSDDDIMTLIYPDEH